MNNEFLKVLEQLYCRFYESRQSFSEVTSSHWKNVGWHKASFGGGKWKLAGGGFGDWRYDGLFNRLRNISASNAIDGLQSKYKCEQGLWLLGKAVAKSQNRLFNYDCAKQVLSLATIVRNIESANPRFPLTSAGIKKVCVIGDGYGYLGSLVKAYDPGVVVTSVNLGRGLLFDVYYTGLRFPAATACLSGDESICEGKDFTFMPAEDYASLQDEPQDLVLNIASMQEMNLNVVRNYMQYIRRRDGKRTLFYCCNRVKKILPDGEIVQFDQYGWSENDSTIFDELCPWYQTFPHGLITTWRPFDGEIKHRLVYLHAAGGGDVAPVRS